MIAPWPLVEVEDVSGGDDGGAGVIILCSVDSFLFLRTFVVFLCSK
jgi:hypothetical protein